jgi:hypothetical protein
MQLKPATITKIIERSISATPSTIDLAVNPAVIAPNESGYSNERKSLSSYFLIVSHAKQFVPWVRLVLSLASRRYDD